MTTRVSVAIASAYDRTRVQACELSRGEIRELSANFNGVLDKTEMIASAIWRITQPWGAILTAPTISADGKRTGCTLQAGIGRAHVKALVTTTTGRQLPQLFRIDVDQSPWFQGETAVTGGPYELTVVADEEEPGP